MRIAPVNFSSAANFKPKFKQNYSNSNSKPDNVSFSGLSAKTMQRGAAGLIAAIGLFTAGIPVARAASGEPQAEVQVQEEKMSTTEEKMPTTIYDNQQIIYDYPEVEPTIIYDNEQIIYDIPEAEPTIILDNQQIIYDIPWKDEQGLHIRQDQLADLLDHFNLGSNKVVFDNETKAINPLFNKDIECLMEAKAAGEGFEDYYVKKYENKKEAAEKAEAGDVFAIEGKKNVGIKLSDGKIKELGLSKEAYIALFPPVTKYLIQQGHINDCYLVGSFNPMMRTPEGYAQLLSCFRECFDGSVSVAFPKGNAIFNLEKGEHTEDAVKGMLGQEIQMMFGTKTVINENQDAYATTCEGLKMIEHLYGMEMLYRQAEKSENTKELLEALKDPNCEPGKLAELNFYFWSECNDVTKATTIRAYGGAQDDFLKLFNTKRIEGANCTYSPQIKEILEDPSQWGNKIITAGTFARAVDGIMNNHAYGVIPVETEKGIVMQLVNPWNTSVVHKEFPIQEFEKNFNDITIYEIK